MDVDQLRAELEQVTAELEGAKMEYASLGAKIAGLEARKAALSRAIPGTVEQGNFGSADIPAKYRTEDIVEVLTAVGTEMTIKQVISALHESGRAAESKARSLCSASGTPCGPRSHRDHTHAGQPQ
jgi:hypothetical protein